MEYKKSYKELIKIPTFKERFNYLKLDQKIGQETFGYSRHLNQTFYQSPEWKKVRDMVIIRDSACDLGIKGYEIFKYALIHHINPITMEDILNRSEAVLDMNNLICVSHKTHNAIHFGDESQIFTGLVERTPNDTCLWER